MRSMDTQGVKCTVVTNEHEKRIKRQPSTISSTKTTTTTRKNPTQIENHVRPVNGPQPFFLRSVSNIVFISIETGDGVRKEFVFGYSLGSQLAKIDCRDPFLFCWWNNLDQHLFDHPSSWSWWLFRTARSLNPSFILSTHFFGRTKKKRRKNWWKGRRWAWVIRCAGPVRRACVGVCRPILPLYVYLYV